MTVQVHERPYPRRLGRMAAGAILSAMAGTCGSAGAGNEAAPAALGLAAEPIRPVPARVEVDPAKVALGERLFRDPLLSHDGTVSCASCHSLTTGGTDRRSHSVGIGGAQGALNAPTVFNSGFNFRQFWDGRAASLEDQIDGPVQNPGEMGGRWSEVLAKLSQAPDYAAAFARLYADGVTHNNVKNAIAEYERSLITPNSRFDRYLRGDAQALNEDEKAGYQKFKAYGCVSCHQGINIGGNMFQRMGVMGDYFNDRGSIIQSDFGRFNVTGDEADKFTFKVPSLRNVAVTSPYFHDGSAQTLDQAVTTMARYQLGRELPPKDRDQLVAFLRTLTGEYQGRPL